MEKFELIVVSPPGVSHLQSAVEIVKRLVGRNNRLLATIMVLKLPNDPKHHLYINSLHSSTSTNSIKYIELSVDDAFINTNPPCIFTTIIDGNISLIRETIINHIKHSSSRVIGLLLDMFCTSVIDIADEFALPSYLFFPSNASFLGLMFHLQKLVDMENIDVAMFKDDPNGELDFPYFKNPLPKKVLPNVMLMSDSASIFTRHARRFRETKAIIINTFLELEPHVVKTLMDDGDIPPVYPVGRVINIERNPITNGNVCKTMEWLDQQPDSSVVFLCFGSMGSFKEDQLKEIALALEQCGHRFVWTVKKGNKISFTSEEADFQEILPEGFLERIAGRGKVIDWAPQVEVLAHRATGGFISHCGWNSTLESIWFGVPIATWPLHAEQQLNAFLLVVELSLGVEIKMDYRWGIRIQSEEVVMAERIEKGIRMLMTKGDKRKKFKEIGEKCRLTSVEGSSSLVNLDSFINFVLENVPSSNTFVPRK